MKVEFPGALEQRRTVRMPFVLWRVYVFSESPKTLS
jgi:hypothetical protein